MSHHLVAGISDAPHAHEPHAADAHVGEAPVLAGPQVHHPAPVVGLLVHQPVAVRHVTGHTVGHAETVHDVVAVIHQLAHLASEVLPLIDSHPVGTSVHGDHAAGPDAVSHARHAHVVGVVAPSQEVLV